MSPSTIVTVMKMLEELPENLQDSDTRTLARIYFRNTGRSTVRYLIQKVAN
jgi:hypothetical protein